MGIMDFVNLCKDFFMLMLSAISTSIGSLFAMPLFGAISVGHIFLGITAFVIVFGFIIGSVTDKFGGD